MSDLTQTGSRQEPALASLPLSEDEARRASAPAAPARFPWLPVVGLVVVAAAAFVVWRMQSSSPVAPIRGAAVAPPAAAANEAPPAIRYPIEAARVGHTPPAAADAQGEPALLASLLALPGATGLDRLIATDDVVHRFVATVDNLPRVSVASKVMLVRPADGAFAIDSDDGRASLGRSNASRYVAYVRALQSLDTAPLVALYVRNYPAFQQAYRDLGYPNGYFNDRLVDVIDHLLAAPEPTEPPTLLQPKVLYEFANPDLEARSAGQKALMRLGPEGERAAKAKLRDLRLALTASVPKQ